MSDKEMWAPGNKTGPGAIAEGDASYEASLRKPGTLDGEDRTKPVGMRRFKTGATRNLDSNKLDYEGFLNPLVLERYATFMQKHRVQSDGERRASDNWQLGMPVPEFIKSLVRHTLDAWKENRGYKTQDGLEDALCACIFNAMGALHELLKQTKSDTKLYYDGYSDRVANTRCP